MKSTGSRSASRISKASAGSDSTAERLAELGRRRKVRLCLLALAICVSTSAAIGLSLRVLSSPEQHDPGLGEAAIVEIAGDLERGETTIRFLKHLQKALSIDKDSNAAWDAVPLDGVDADVLLHIDFYLSVLENLADLKQREFLARAGMALFDIATRPEKPSELLQYEDRAKYHEVLDLYEIADELHRQEALMNQATIGQTVQAQLINLQAGVQTMEAKLAERLSDRYGDTGEQIFAELTRLKREHLDQAKHNLQAEYVPATGLPAVEQQDLVEAARTGTILFKLVASFPEEGLYKIVLMNRTERELTVTVPVGSTLTGQGDIAIVGLSQNRDSEAVINSVNLPSLYPVTYYVRGYRLASTPLARVSYRNFVPTTAGPPVDAVIRHWLDAVPRDSVDDLVQQRILIYRKNLLLAELNDWNSHWNLSRNDYDKLQADVVAAIQDHHEKFHGFLDNTTFRRMVDSYAGLQNVHSIWRQETNDKVIIHEAVFERSSGRMLSRAGDFEKPGLLRNVDGVSFQSGLQEIYDGRQTRSQSVSRIVIGPQSQHHERPLGHPSLTNTVDYEFVLLRHPHGIRLDLYLPEFYSVEELPPNASDPRPGLRFSSKDAADANRAEATAFVLRLNPETFLIESVGGGEEAPEWKLIARDLAPTIPESTFDWDTQYRALILRMEAVQRLITAGLTDHLRLPDLSNDPTIVAVSPTGGPLPEGQPLQILKRGFTECDRPAVCLSRDDRVKAGVTNIHMQNLFLKQWKRDYPKYRTEMFIVVPGGKVTKVAPDIIGQTLNVHWEPDPQASAAAEAVLVSAPTNARIQRVEWRPSEPTGAPASMPKTRQIASGAKPTRQPSGTTTKPDDPKTPSDSTTDSPVVTEYPFRTWTHYKGGTFEARLISVEGNKVTLEDKKGKRAVLPSPHLSNEDRAYLRELKYGK